MDIIDTRQYYGDSYTWHFDANVVEVSNDANAPCAVLDATYFYPTSGGQPHDLGTLGAVGNARGTRNPQWKCTIRKVLLQWALLTAFMEN